MAIESLAAALNRILFPGVPNSPMQLTIGALLFRWYPPLIQPIARSELHVLRALFYAWVLRQCDQDANMSVSIELMFRKLPMEATDHVRGFAMYLGRSWFGLRLQPEDTEKQKVIQMIPDVKPDCVDSEGP